MIRPTRRYQPVFSWRPIVFVRWRSASHGYGDARLAWKLYAFGLFPIGKLPRRAS